jgi:hypothetical protein
MKCFDYFCFQFFLPWLASYSLFFITGHASGGHVTLTDGDCRIYYTIMSMLLHNSYISYGNSDRHVVYLQELLWRHACVHLMMRPSSEEWHIPIGPWFIVDACCVVLWILCLWVFIATPWTVTNWSSLEVVYGLLYQLMCKQTLNTLIRIEVIWSTKLTWNMCIIWYFSSVINSNKQRSNETLDGAVIQISDLQDRRRACYQLSHAASLLVSNIGSQKTSLTQLNTIFLFLSKCWSS